jgi:hypothetical protein
MALVDRTRRCWDPSYTESAFTNFGNATVTAVNDFGSKRCIYKPYTRIGQDLNLDERAKVAIEYAALIGNRDRAPAGTVQSLAWIWGLYTTNTIREIYYKFKYGDTIFNQRGRATRDKIMDVLTNHETVISILVNRKGRVSGRRLAAAFKIATGLAVARSTLVRHLKGLGLEICRRRYSPVLTETHKVTRHRFGTKYRHEKFDRWIDLDEKWLVFVLY